MNDSYSLLSTSVKTPAEHRGAARVAFQTAVAGALVALLLVAGACRSGAGAPASTLPRGASGQAALSNQAASTQEPTREPLSEDAALRALYPRMDAGNGIVDPEHPRHAIGAVSILDFERADHACVVTLVRSMETTPDMDSKERDDIESTAEIIYDMAVLRVSAGAVEVRARRREVFAASTPGSGYPVEVQGKVEFEDIWHISEKQDAILIHASGQGTSESIGGNEFEGEYNYQESAGLAHYALYGLVGTRLEPIFTATAESLSTMDDTAPSEEEGRSVVEREIQLDILDTSTSGYSDIELRTLVRRSEGLDEPKEEETVERYVWDGTRYARAAP